MVCTRGYTNFNGRAKFNERKIKLVAELKDDVLRSSCICTNALDNLLGISCSTLLILIHYRVMKLIAILTKQDVVA